MAAGIYAGEERFFQVVTLMAPSFAKIPGGNSTTSSSGRALSISRPCRLSKTKGLLDIFPSGKWRLQSPSLVQSLPGVSQAPVRAELCPELKGVFVCHQVFIEQLLHARHRNEMKAGVRLITRRRRVWQAPPPHTPPGSFTGHFLREASPGPLPPVIYSHSKWLFSLLTTLTPLITQYLSTLLHY